jgi:hypothetical protein
MGRGHRLGPATPPGHSRPQMLRLSPAPNLEPRRCCCCCHPLFRHALHRLQQALPLPHCHCRLRFCYPLPGDAGHPATYLCSSLPLPFFAILLEAEAATPNTLVVRTRRPKRPAFPRRTRHIGTSYRCASPRSFIRGISQANNATAICPAISKAVFAVAINWPSFPREIGLQARYTKKADLAAAHKSRCFAYSHIKHARIRNPAAYSDIPSHHSSITPIPTPLLQPSERCSNFGRSPAERRRL